MCSSPQGQSSITIHLSGSVRAQSMSMRASAASRLTGGPGISPRPSLPSSIYRPPPYELVAVLVPDPYESGSLPVCILLTGGTPAVGGTFGGHQPVQTMWVPIFSPPRGTCVRRCSSHTYPHDPKIVGMSYSASCSLSSIEHKSQHRVGPGRWIVLISSG